MEMTNFFDVFLSPWAQAKLFHTVSAGYCTGAAFVLAISAWYMLKGRDMDFAKRSFRIAAVFGLVAAIFSPLSRAMNLVTSSLRISLQKSPRWKAFGKPNLRLLRWLSLRLPTPN